MWPLEELAGRASPVLSGEESAASVGDMGSIPGLGRSHVPGSNEARMPQLLGLLAREPTVHDERKGQAAMETQHSQIKTITLYTQIEKN